ncbi:MAG: NADH-quinone oxidoreductase subunit J [Thermoanaerobaculia bacterium]|nr:NADH-quinone oxidoreductase subunit J [Thermoanaerobaculia bacterium]
MAGTIVFVLAALAAFVSALVVVAHRNPVYSVMSLIVTLLSLAVLFVQLAGHFLAVLLILVYAGAILVLFLFVIMLLNVGTDRRGLAGTRLQRWGAIVGAVLFAAILASLQWGATLDAAPPTEDEVALTPLARALFGDYLLPFEMAGLLLLAAVVAATVIARRTTPEERESR